MSNFHEATPEELAIANDGDEMARNKQYVKLGIAVVIQAIQDATLDVPPVDTPGTWDQKRNWNRQRADRDEAKAFLMTENSDLAFWCWIAGIHASAVVHYAKRAKGRWTELGDALRASRLHMRKAS